MSIFKEQLLSVLDEIKGSGYFIATDNRPFLFPGLVFSEISIRLKKKKKNTNKGNTQTRSRRLIQAKEGTRTYTGKNLVRGYAKLCHTDLLCAIKELKMLGIVVSDEYKEAIRRSLDDRTIQNTKKKEMAESQNGISDFKDEHFTFIAGYTSGGAAYGLTREETP